MTDQQTSIREIFLSAVEKYKPEEWSTFLDGVCRDDAHVRQRVEELLKSHQQLGTFQEEAATVDSSRGSDYQAGTTVGCFKLLEQIGEGGMGVVFMAEQIEPVHRKVALKIIKAGMDSRQVIARFEAERQALAMMDHHHIAKVLEAGTTELGRPYFAMELVKGVPITTYADLNQLTLGERLELFIPVCHAIQHAHQKGIIHRDIKPSNVLVTLYDGHPVPKVIDFGIAKATQQRLTEKTMFTQLGQIMGTVEYMSPEQAEMNQLDVDTRSDIYSLGVLLYELLTGTTPITKEQLRDIGVHEMVKAIRDVEPPKPSTRLTQSGPSLPSISAVRRTDPAKLTRAVRGDLDWIVMKALEKDRSRRYETASAFAADVDRFLREEVVKARPPTTIYKLQKFSQRNKALLCILSSITLILLAASVISTWLAFRALKSEDLANQRLRSEQTALSKARQAEVTATQRLFESYLAQAQASRWSGRPGQRLNAMAAIRKAAALLEPLRLGENAKRVLRNEAIAATTSVDVIEGSSWRVRYDTECDFALSPDLKMLAVDDRLADVPGTVIRRLDAPDSDPLRVRLASRKSSRPTFSRDGKLVAVEYDYDRAVGVWDIATRQQLLDVEQTAKAFSRDGTRFAVGRADGAVHIHELPGGKLLYKHQTEDGSIAALSFSPDGQRIAVAYLDRDVIEIRDVAHGGIFSQLTASDESIGKIAWHPNGRLLAIAGWQTVDVWDFTNDRQESVVMLGHESQIMNVQFHPTRQILLSDSWDGTTRIWNSVTGDQMLQLRGTRANFDETGRWLMLGRGLNLSKWEIVEPEACRWLYPGSVYSVAARDDGRLIALATADGIKIWDALASVMLAALPTGFTLGVAFHPISGDLLSSGEMGVLVWPIEMTPTAGRMRVGPPAELDPTVKQTGFVSLSRDGTTLVVDHKHNGIRHWYATVMRFDDSSPAKYELKHPHLSLVAASPDGRWIATGNKWGKDVQIWNASSGDHVCRLQSEGSAVPTFSPDSRWIVSNSGEAVRFWEVGSWQLRHEFAAAATSGSATAFTADSRMAVIARVGQGLLLLDVASGQPLATLETNARRPRIEGLCFTADGDKIIAAAGTRGVYLWDLQTIRQRLSELGLDWDPPAKEKIRPMPPVTLLRAEIDLGEMATD